MKLLKLIVGTIVNPKKTFTELNNDPKGFFYSIVLLLLLGGAFSVIYVIFLLTGKEPGLPPLYNFDIIKLSYYWWLIIVGMPMIIVLYILVPGITEFLSVFFKGKNDYKKAFTIFAFSINVPFIFYFFAELAILIMLLINNLIKPTYNMVVFIMIFYFAVALWTMILAPIVVRIVYQISIFKSIISGVFAMFFFWAIMSFLVL